MTDRSGLGGTWADCGDGSGDTCWYEVEGLDEDVEVKAGGAGGGAQSFWYWLTNAFPIVGGFENNVFEKLRNKRENLQQNRQDNLAKRNQSEEPAVSEAAAAAPAATATQITADPTKAEGPNWKAGLRGLFATIATDLLAAYADRQPCGTKKQTLHSIATLGYTAAGVEFTALSIRAGLGAAVTPPGIDILSAGISLGFAYGAGDTLGKAVAQGELAFSDGGCR
jgi:hypothetical protein